MSTGDFPYTQYDADVLFEFIRKMGAAPSLGKSGSTILPPYTPKDEEEPVTWDAATLQDVLERLRRLEHITSIILLAGGINVAGSGNNSKTEGTVPGQ
jgi:hypothetical protein